MINKITRKKSLLVVLGTTMLLPWSAQADTPTTYKELVDYVLDFINILIPTIFAMLFIYFMWMMIDAWIINAGDPKKHEAGRNYAISAVIAFVIMISTWGIVSLIKNSIFG